MQCTVLSAASQITCYNQTNDLTKYGTVSTSEIAEQISERAKVGDMGGGAVDGYPGSKSKYIYYSEKQNSSVEQL